MIRRIKITYLSFFLSLTVLLVHLFSVASNTGYRTVGVGQSSRTLTVATARGTIYDRNGLPLVNAARRYCAAILPDAALLQRVKSATTPEEYQRLQACVRSGTPAVVSLTEPVGVTAGLNLFRVPLRYASSAVCAHLIGYLDSGGQSGISGLEKVYDELLQSYGGQIEITYRVNGAGSYQTDTAPRVKNTIDNASGGIRLTIDRTVQEQLDTLAPQYMTKGAALVLDAQTGDLLASTSLPTFHPQDLATSLQQDDGALVNRLFSPYDCGSVFKIVTAAAALEAGVSPEQKYTCAGSLCCEDTVFHCHQRLGHQALDMSEAFAQSCNLYFIQLAQAIGPEAILAMADQLGLYESIPLADTLTAAPATLPALSELSPAALANLAFGQGKLLITPLHIARLTAAVATGGMLPAVQAVQGTVNQKGSITALERRAGETVLSQATANALQAMMRRVVTDGTATRANSADTAIAGKTGTAETGQYTDDGLPVVQSWFTGYFPADNPQYVVTVVAEDAQNTDSDALGLFCEISNKLTQKARNGN